jgi:hypothetical protein
MRTPREEAEGTSIFLTKGFNKRKDEIHAKEIRKQKEASKRRKKAEKLRKKSLARK